MVKEFGILILCSVVLTSDGSFATSCVWGKSFRVRRVCGIVTDLTGAVIPNANVEIDTYDLDTLKTKAKVSETTSDSEGRFSMEHVQAGKYIIRTKVAGFAEATQPFEVANPSSKASVCTKLIEIVLRPAGSCSGVKNAFKDWKN